MTASFFFFLRNCSLSELWFHTCFLMASRSLSRTKSSLSWTLVSLVLRGSENSWKKLSSGSKLLSVWTNSIYLYTKKEKQENNMEFLTKRKCQKFRKWINRHILLHTCWPACHRFHWEEKCLSADRACFWIPGSTWSSSGSSGSTLWPGSLSCLGCLLLWLPYSPLLLQLR